MEAQESGTASGTLDLLWAKLPRGDDGQSGYHPLLAHLIDVAQVTRALWRDVLPQSAGVAIARDLGVPPEVVGRWVAFWAGAHDLGKASPAFAQQNPAAWERIRQGGYVCPRAPTKPRDAPHGTITAATLPASLTTDLGVPEWLAEQIGQLVGGHHGVFPRAENIEDMVSNPRALGDRTWGDARIQLTRRLAELLAVEGTFPASAQLTNPSIMYLAGLVTVADWIGSNAEYFKFRVPDPDAHEAIDWPEYLQVSEQRASRALQGLGWLGWSGPIERTTFAARFPQITTPNTLQVATERLADTLRGPSLVVIEAPMGDGKTEAALFLADRLGADLGQRGVYVAMPTQATSNQMFGRVRRYLEERHGGEMVNLQLLHGHAELSAELRGLRENARTALFQPTNIHDDDPAPAHQDATVVAAEWFSARKRGLLAPFGVGTVDQALLAVLKTRHGFVRLFGLGHKTIIIDEVHAYDTYMTTLLEVLLQWLAALGASVVLLSATLPRARLAALTAAYAAGRTLPAGAPTTAPETTYPRITWVDDAGTNAEPVKLSGRSASVRIKRLASALPTLEESYSAQPWPPFKLGVQLARELEAGGCAAVICTTVGRAQRMYAALKRQFADLADDVRPDVCLFHARYRFVERDAREQDALARFGKPSPSPDGTSTTAGRPARAILVATQVIEQSLDLDFDLMVSELAPIDLILQRLGRLHRHVRTDRPAHLAEPTLWLLEPPVEDGVPVFDDGQQFVYHPHILLRTWLTLQGRTAINLPADVEPLIECVYGESSACPADASAGVQTRWAATASDLAAERIEQERKAKNAVIALPNYEGSIFELFNDQLAEDDPTAHQSLRALTRLGDPSLPVVLLRPDEHQRAETGSQRPDLAAVQALLERSAALSHRGLVPYLLKEGAQEALPPSGWRRSALLRHHRLFLLDGDGQIVVGRYVVRLDPNLGILVERR